MAKKGSFLSSLFKRKDKPEQDASQAEQDDPKASQNQGEEAEPDSPKTSQDLAQDDAEEKARKPEEIASDLDPEAGGRLDSENVEQEASAPEQDDSKAKQRLASEQDTSAQDVAVQKQSYAAGEPTAESDLPSAVDDAATAMAESAAKDQNDPKASQHHVPEQDEPKARQGLASEPEPEPTPEPNAKPEKKGWWSRLTQGLKKTSGNLGSGLSTLFKGKKIDDELFEDLETQLLMADVGVETTTRIIDDLTEHASRKELKDAELLYERLKELLQELLVPVSKPLEIPQGEGPFVILMTGVNGVGKTTTIGKLARQFQNEGKSVMLAAGDTFRAAAVEQLEIWGERNNIPVIAQHTGADSASVIYDAVEAAKARKVDVLIADTAGRLQNKANLMEELKKIVRVMRKLDASMPHEVLLTLDAGTGQNAISQTQLFNEAVGLTGLVMTKLDGTAKGGVIFALADKFGIPIRYIGVGEQLDDLRPFVADEFVNALFDD